MEDIFEKYKEILREGIFEKYKEILRECIFEKYKEIWRKNKHFFSVLNCSILSIIIPLIRGL